MARLPEFVYLIQVEGEWPWSAVAGDHPSAASEVVAEVLRRGKASGTVHAWQVSLAGATEIEAVPEHVVPDALEPK